MYDLRFAEGVASDLKKVPVTDRRRILDSLEEQLVHQPNVVTKNRKILIDLTPSWEANPPIWELRIGIYRVFYDIDENEKAVYVRAVRTKPPHKQTEDIL